MVDPARPPDPPAEPTRSAADRTDLTDPLPARRRRWQRPAAWAGAALVLGGVAFAAAVAIVGLTTTAGARAALGLVPGLQAEGLAGSWLGGLTADRLQWRGAGGTEVEARGIHLAPLLLSWRGAGPALIGVRTERLRVDRLDLRPAPGDAAPPTLPATLELPVALDVDRLSVGLLGWSPTAVPVQDLGGRIALGSSGSAAGADPGQTHAITGLSARWAGLQAEGDLQLSAHAPFEVQARVSVASTMPTAEAPTPWPAWTARVDVDGPLARLDVRGALRAEDQGLDAEAVVRPQAAMPLDRLSLTARALNLAALRAGWPRTELSGTVEVAPAANDPKAPLRIVADLRNALPLAAHQGGLPATSAKAQARWQPSTADQLTVESLDVQLADARGAAGRLRGQARWTATDGEADLQVDDLLARRLDARAPPVQLQGRVQLRAADVGAASAAGGAPRLEADLALQGRAVDTSVDRPVALTGRLIVTREQVSLQNLEALANGSSMRLSATVQRGLQAGVPAAGLALASWPDSALSIAGQLELRQFDPSFWWAGPAGSSWRRGPHRLNGSAEVKGRWPAGAVRRGAWPVGNVTAVVQDSVLAGVPVSLQMNGQRGGQGEASVRVALQAGPNRADLDLAVAGREEADRLTLQLRAPALRALQPFVTWWPGANDAGSADAIAGAANAAGAVEVDLSASGRWPRLQAEVRADVRGLQWGNASLAAGTLQGRFAPGVDEPLQLEASVQAGRWRGRRLDAASARLDGTLRRHQARAEALIAAVPPDAIRALAGQTGPPPPAQRTRLSLALQGGWDADAAPGAAERALDPVVAAWQAGQPTRWRGRLESLELASTGSTPGTWVRAGPVDLDVRPPATAVPRGWTVEAGAGTVSALGAVLRLDALRFAERASPSPPEIVLQAELEPLEVAPWLRRAQPDFGWEGDLRVGGRVDVRSGARTDVDIVLGRRSGDLRVRDEVGVEPLGLEEARVSLEARDGTWTFSAGLAGKVLGAASMLAVVQTTPTALWPEPNAPLRGVVEAQADNLSTWGAWVPAGWRLGGGLRLNAALAGTFGAPQWTGELRGQQLSVRNLLQGVNVTDGEVAVALQGTTARIDRVHARAGGGSITMTGDATLGEQPKARLAVVADRFQALGRIDRRLVVSGDAQADFDRQGLRLGGRLAVDEALIDFTRADAPSLGDDVVVVRDPAAAETAVEPRAVVVDPATGRRSLGGAAARAVVLDLAVDLGPRLRLRGRGLDTGLRGELRLSSPNNRLAIHGSVRTVDGTYAAYGQKLAITRGVLTFGGAPDNPRLDVQATRPDVDIVVGVAVTGSAADPRVRLFSEPEMAETEKLSWLLLGRGSDGLGRNDLALLQRAALAVLAGENSTGQDPLSAALGLDDLSVRQGEGDTRETIVSVGKQLHRRWYVGYERSLNATAGTWQLIYRLAQRFTVRAQSGADNSLDLIWTVRWQ